MKSYNKPNTKVHEIELVQMIAQSIGKGSGQESADNSDARGYDYSSSSTWGSDEEE